MDRVHLRDRHNAAPDAEHPQDRAVLVGLRPSALERPEPARAVGAAGGRVVLARMGPAERLYLQVLDLAVAEKGFRGVEQRRADPAAMALGPHAHDVELRSGLAVQLQREEAVAAD